VPEHKLEITILNRHMSVLGRWEAYDSFRSSLLNSLRAEIGGHTPGEGRGELNESSTHVLLEPNASAQKPVTPDKHQTLD
jgi:hypothetical protein